MYNIGHATCNLFKIALAVAYTIDIQSPMGSTQAAINFPSSMETPHIAAFPLLVAPVRSTHM